MERTEIHELSAAYALDALGPEELDEFEKHLAHCAECREHVAAFQETVAELAYDVDAPAPSPALRNRVLADARREQPKVVADAPPALGLPDRRGRGVRRRLRRARSRVLGFRSRAAARRRARRAPPRRRGRDRSLRPDDQPDPARRRQRHPRREARLVRGLDARERPRRGARGKDVRSVGDRGRRGDRRPACSPAAASGRSCRSPSPFPRARSSPSRSRRPAASSSPRRTRSS